MQPEVDKTVVEKVIEGDPQAFNELVNAYRNSVYYLCLKILRVREEAEEVAQDVFVKLLKQLRKFKGESKLSTWIFRITYNECISKVRKNRKYQAQENVEEYDIGFIETSYEKIDRQKRSELLDKALTELDDDSKMLVLMYYYHGNSIEEVADITRLTRENVKVKLFRARKRLLFILERKFKLKKHDWI